MATFTEDKNAIIGILQFTEKLLAHLIRHLPPEEQPRFLAAWQQEVKARLDDVIGQILAIQSESSPQWTRIVNAGLSGPSLDLKRHLLASSAEDGLLKRFLRILNSWLGSLADAIPGAHPIKELKELLEEFLNGTPEPNTDFVTLFNAGGFVPFGLPGSAPRRPPKRGASRAR
jgi:hypothetical protein